MLSKNLILGLGASTLTYAIDMQAKSDTHHPAVVELLAQITAEAAATAKADAQALMDFLNFASTHNKSYTSTEALELRADLFKESTEKVAAMNSQSPEGSATFANNVTSDMTASEFGDMMGLKTENETSPPNVAADFVQEKTGLSHTDECVDWSSAENP